MHSYSTVLLDTPSTKTLSRNALVWYFGLEKFSVFPTTRKKKMLVFQLDCLINTVCSVAAPGAETPVLVQKSG